MSPDRRRPTQAVILVGGEGTRLRPVTSRVPKPVAPVVERPFVAYILDDLVRHGVERAIFSTGFLAEAIEAEIGDGARYGLQVDYAVESEPLGTAGAVANCADKLDQGSFYVFNGDVLSDVDLSALADLHADKGGMGTIFLTPVEDPRRYGLVELRADGSVASFLEKPSEWQGVALINAGVYVLEPEVLEMIPRGRLFSIERGVFPPLAQAGSLYGYVGTGYWRDIGTPESYLQAHFDILERTVRTEVGDVLGEQYLFIAPSAVVDAGARIVPPCYVGEEAHVEAGARVGPLAVLGAGARVAAGATIVQSVIQAGVTIGARAQIEHSIVVRDSTIGAGSHLHGAIVGQDCKVGADNRLVRGICVYPQTLLPDGSIQFHEQLRGKEGLMAIPDDIFKVYDVRGLYPQELDEEVAERIGCALAQQLGATRLGTGMDPRPSSTGLLEAFAAGAAAGGAGTVDFGLVPTEMLYFGVASLGLDGGVMVTASHNPPQYNGMKLVGAGALPLSGEQGIPELKERSQAIAELPPRLGAAGYERLDLYAAYVAHLHALVDTASFRPYRVVMDAANGVAGKLAPLVFDGTPVDRVEMYFAVDGTFPNHAPNPLLEENSREIRARVVAEKADLGIAWDGDADRCFFIDEHGEFVPGDFVTALLAEALLLKHPGAAILYDLRASRAVPDVIRANGGVPLLNRVGHAFFKQRMRREPVLFGGEVSGHYYFSDNYNADSGFIPALLILDLLSRKNATMAELLEPLRARYFMSGEINSTVDDVDAAQARLEARFADGAITRLDGVSVDYERWHFNVRPSNTEPLLRLNLGADTQELMEEKRDLVLEVIREH